jgi:hypothetical protein
MPKQVRPPAAIEIMAEKALDELEARNELLFQRDGRLVEVKEPEGGAIEERPITKALLISHLRRCGLPYSDKELGHTAIHILHHSDLAGLRNLTSVHTSPVLRPDFSLVPEGYDEATGILYVPNATVREHHFNTDATVSQAKKAYALLRYPFADFPFVDEADRLSVIAFVLTLVARTAMDYLVPVLAVDANGQGAGKSLVVRAIHWIVAGKEPKMIAFERNIAEVDKGIKASLVHGAKIIVVDNIVGHFRSSVLASLVTSKEPSIRMLGSFNQPQILHRADYSLNGNNLEFDADLSKRVIWSKMWHPDLGSRKNTDYQVWKDYGTDLVSHLATDWLTYMDAAMTVIQGWRNAGTPKQKARSPLDKYRTWECNIGGMLQFVGAEGFLSKHQERMTEANEELQEIIRFMDNIEKRFPIVLESTDM